MATHFVAPQPAPYQQHAYTKSAQYAPVDSGAKTPGRVSPPSPRTASHMPTNPHHAPPIRPLKQPIYVPAALRRTQKPGRLSSPKNDSVIDMPTSGWCTRTSISQGAGDETSMSPISRIATEDLHSIYNDIPLSPISGPITKNHWQPDSSTTTCTASCCQHQFSFFSRRHHCRKCGGIFCWLHSQRQVRLNEHALFHPEGDWQRSCDRCHAQYRDWERMRSSRTNSESGTAAVQVDAAQAKPQENPRIGGLASSFGGNWNWSTF